jgi:hypothetical protein
MMDGDDEIMLSASHSSQFTQSLLLFVRLDVLHCCLFSHRAIASHKHSQEIDIRPILRVSIHLWGRSC